MLLSIGTEGRHDECPCGNIDFFLASPCVEILAAKIYHQSYFQAKHAIVFDAVIKKYSFKIQVFNFTYLACIGHVGCFGYSS